MDVNWRSVFWEADRPEEARAAISSFLKRADLIKVGSLYWG